MKPIEVTDMIPASVYAEKRDAIRAEMITHKKYRRVLVGPNAVFYFEDRATLMYQIQEMVYVEGNNTSLEEEVAVYGPLLPRGEELVATVMLEFPEPVRHEWLHRLANVEQHMYLTIGEDKPIHATPVGAQDGGPKTSSVHFIRFALSPDHMADFQNLSLPVTLGINHPDYAYAIHLTPEIRRSLAHDFASAHRKL